MLLVHGRRGILGAWLVVLLLFAGVAEAGGPLILRGNGLPYVWNTAGPIQYRTDDGPLSASVSEAQALSRVDAMFDVWQNVASSNISYDQIGLILNAGAYSGGDVDTLAEFDAVQTACFNGSQSPIVYDADGSIIVDLGMDETSVIGFAGPCALNATQILSGRAVMNGLFQDGQATPVQDLPTNLFDAAFVHEFGHFSGLDHSQINVNCLTSCGLDDLAGLPTMFPLAVHESQESLSIDDVAWISRLYPQAGAGGFAATHGTITGVVFFSDGESHAQLVNVIARQVNTGGGQDRSNAASGVSGYRFRIFHGNPILGGGGSSFGSAAPGDVGLYEISVPPGDYTIEVETIDQEFVDGSSVGGPIRIPMPGIAPDPIGPITVTAGATSSGHDVTLINSDPRFDAWEGP